MKIVILDGYTLNPGDLDWDVLKQFGDVTIYDRTPVDQVVERSLGAGAIFTNKTPVTQQHIGQLPELKFIGVLATGYNITDIEAASRQGIVVSNVPGYSTASVAQLVFALLLELCHHIQRHSDAVMEGKWARSKDFCFWDYPLMELSGKTMGIVGLGDIGKKVADIAAAFGMKVIAASRTKSDQSHRANFSWVEMDELLRHADVVSLHCPLLPETKGMINKDALSLMKRSAFLINTSRGPLVNDEDLADALNRDVISGAGLDVLTNEPPHEDNPLFKAKNCIITPHIAWATKEARTRMMKMSIDNLQAFVTGTPINVVNR